jgi:hypothetical protein
MNVRVSGAEEALDGHKILCLDDVQALRPKTDDSIG